MWLVLLAFAIQVIFQVSIFDIHFQSPVVHGMIPYSSLVPAPAKRLVLFSADGLRADTFLSSGGDRQPNAPFLRSVASSRGRWGVSHTRVPTESRPGHVALVAGLYEDPSAVFKGWKENPVEFDSIFNQSMHTFAWGSPDILTMFAKGSRNMTAYTYGPESEEFTGHEAYRLDQWVFDRFEAFLAATPKNSTLKDLLNNERIVFFFHLLGLDTNGHTNKPHSQLYADNLRYVDHGVAKIESLINSYYQDNETAFIFTSDHGMTDWGSHGAGHPSETETPIVAWGRGVNAGADSNNWEKGRIDVQQADLAPLMATLIGASIPVNSVGKLPLSYLADDLLLKSHAGLANARQLCATFEALSMQQRSRSIGWRLRSFEPLHGGSASEDIRDIAAYIKTGLYEESINKSYQLMDLCLQGTEFYHKYDQFQLKICITIAYFGWIIVLAIYLIQDQIPQHSLVNSKKRSRKLVPADRITLALAAAISTILTVEKAPLLYYAYHLLPLLLWWYTLRQWALVKRIKPRKRSFVWFVLTVASLELLVAAFFHRWMLSIGLCFLALWPHWNYNSQRRQHEYLSAIWTINCILLALFPVLPPVGKESLPILVDIGGIAMTVIAVWSSLVMHHDRDRTILVSYTLAIPIAIYVTHSVHESLVQGSGLALLEQTLSWMTLGLPVTLPLIGPSKMWPRLIGVAVTLIPSLILLSVSYEVIFFFFLLVTMAVWIKLESAIMPSPWQQMRRSYFFLFFTLLSFFGLGNMASVNSFDPSSIRCFITTFSPFTMAALLLWKILIPFIAVSTALWAIIIENRISMRGIYLMILLLSSGMAVQFFHWVTPTGSWLDIGTSISHYMIVTCTVLFIMALHWFVQLLTYGPIYFHRSSKYDKE